MSAAVIFAILPTLRINLFSLVISREDCAIKLIHHLTIWSTIQCGSLRECHQLEIRYWESVRENTCACLSRNKFRATYEQESESFGHKLTFPDERTNTPSSHECITRVDRSTTDCDVKSRIKNIRQRKLICMYDKRLKYAVEGIENSIKYLWFAAEW